jgi:hypothetical protein
VALRRAGSVIFVLVATALAKGDVATLPLAAEHASAEHVALGDAAIFARSWPPRGVRECSESDPVAA